MQYRYNPQLLSLAPSASIALMDKARAMKAQGLDIISLAGGVAAAGCGLVQDALRYPGALPHGKAVW